MYIGNSLKLANNIFDDILTEYYKEDKSKDYLQDKYGIVMSTDIYKVKRDKCIICDTNLITQYLSKQRYKKLIRDSWDKNTIIEFDEVSICTCCKKITNSISHYNNESSIKSNLSCQDLIKGISLYLRPVFTKYDIKQVNNIRNIFSIEDKGPLTKYFTFTTDYVCPSCGKPAKGVPIGRSDKWLYERTSKLIQYTFKVGDTCNNCMCKIKRELEEITRAEQEKVNREKMEFDEQAALCESFWDLNILGQYEVIKASQIALTSENSKRELTNFQFKCIESLYRKGLLLASKREGNNIYLLPLKWKFKEEVDLDFIISWVSKNTEYYIKRQTKSL